MKLKTFLARLDASQQAQFCKLAGTTYTHLIFQVLGGHRGASVRMLRALVSASRTMFPAEKNRWLTFNQLNAELIAAQERRFAARKIQPTRVIA